MRRSRSQTNEIWLSQIDETPQVEVRRQPRPVTGGVGALGAIDASGFGEQPAARRRIWPRSILLLPGRLTAEADYEEGPQEIEEVPRARTAGRGGAPSLSTARPSSFISSSIWSAAS
jgi:hypothetical protein